MTYPESTKSRLIKYFSLLLAIALIIGSLAINCLLIESEQENWKWLKTFFIPVNQNIFSALLSYVVIYLILDIRGLSPSQLLVKEIKSAVQESLKSNDAIPMSSFFYTSYEITQEEIESFDNICLMGITLSEILEKHDEAFLRMLKKKKKIKILIAEPTIDIIKQWSKISQDKEDPGTYQSYFVQTLNSFNKFGKIDRHNLQIRLIPYMPASGLVIMEQKKRCLMWVQIFPQPLRNNNSKYFRITKKSDPSLYQYYQNQFNDIWEKSSVLDWGSLESYKQNNFNKQEQIFMEHFNKNIEPIAQEWYKWKKTFKEDNVAVLRKNFNVFVFNKLITEYTNLHIGEVANRRMLTTSDKYVNIIKEIGEFIKIQNTGNESTIFRLQFTGMLPEEFYNGPQIEYTNINSTPIFFCHKWEGYDDLYAPDKEIAKYKIKRCLFVKDDNLTNPEFSALHSVNDLEEHKDLFFLSQHPITVNSLGDNQYKGVATRLLRYCYNYIKVNGHEHDGFKEELVFIRRIINSQSYKYYPIVKKDKDVTHKLDAKNNLLNRYIEDFHNASDDAVYLKLDEKNMWFFNTLNKINPIFKEGRVPEVTLFSIIDNNNNSSFIFGVKGSYRLYTRDIEIEFFTSLQLQELFKIVYPVFSETHVTQTGEQQYPHAEKIINLIKQ